jgi:branched-chain amino acid aminotransferase
MRKLKVWINGSMAGEDKARISVFDRSFLYGDCAFETMRSYGGVIFRLDDHVDRLFASLDMLKIKPPFSKNAAKSACRKTLEKNCLRDAYVRIALTRGEGRFGISYKDRFVPNVVVVAKPFEGYPAWMHRDGISVAIADTTVNEQSPLCRAKSANFMPYILARFEAKSRGADDAVMLNTRGQVTEGATSNIFVVRDGGLSTPSLKTGALAGITRHEVLHIAGRMRIRAKEGVILPPQLEHADEVFFTNSLAEILPVTKVNSSKIGSGRPGLLTNLIASAYKSLTVAYNKAI